jgi:hypothetical protein
MQIDVPLTVAAFPQPLGSSGRRMGTWRNCPFLRQRVGDSQTRRETAPSTKLMLALGDRTMYRDKRKDSYSPACGTAATGRPESASDEGLLREPLRQVEFPFPALVAVDLHVVVSRVPCPVTCAPCWAVLCTGESNPALPAAHQEAAGFSPPARGCARLRDDYLLHLWFSITPGDRRPSWTAGCARRPRVAAGPGRRPAHAAAPPARR